MAAGDKFLKIHSLLCTLEALRIFSAFGGCYFNDSHQLNISEDEDLTYSTRPPFPPAATSIVGCVSHSSGITFYIGVTVS